MNSPEEKARDILDKVEGVLGHSIPTHSDPYFKETIEIAVICVDEIIATLNSFADYWDLKRGEWYKDELVKIEKIKEEIQKL